MKKIKTGLLGATGMVGQRFIQLLNKHPWFEITCLAASSRSSGEQYQEAVKDRWKLNEGIPDYIKKIRIDNVFNYKEITGKADLVFSALDLDSGQIRELENQYASRGIAVISNNSAHRWTEDIPIIIPEINPDHLRLIEIQRKNRGWKRGLIVVKPNCSIQSYVAILTALKKFEPEKVLVNSLQAISGAGKTFRTWPEMIDNVIPFIGGEEEKSETEPLKIWGEIHQGKLVLAKKPDIMATCIRVPVTNGHLASISVSFKKRPTKKEILDSIRKFNTSLKNLELPSSPKKFIKYFDEENRPQTRLDRDYERGMGVTMGRLREDKFFDWNFIALSHNTIRGAAGGAILCAELLYKKGYLAGKN